MSRTAHLRLTSLETFASALLLSLGVAPLAACASDVIEEGSGGGGGSGAAGSPTSGAGAGTGTGTGTGNGTSSGTSGTGSGGGTATGTGVGGGTSSGVTATSTGVGGGGGGCQDPQPVIVDGVDTGVDTCAGGNLRRREEVACPSVPPGPDDCCGGCPDGTFCSDSGEIACSCVTACDVDADCGEGSLCLCGTPAGRCVPATCQTGADCAAGEECTSWDSSMGCLYPAFACTTPADTCGGDLDCVEPQHYCTVQPDGSRSCVEGGCAIGRPFLVEDEVRTAGLARRADWRAGAALVGPLGAEGSGAAVALPGGPLRAALAEAWEHVGRMEHASIGAFARFSLQLLALGAPPELLERTHQALADETLHARLAFELASAYRGHDVGPGTLPIDGALTGADDVATFVRLTVREGCVGETVAALEAGEAAARAEDPRVAAVLEEVGRDEARHAELAWRTVRWALERFGATAADALRGEIEAVRAELGAPPPAGGDAHDEELLRHGVTSPRLRARLRREALRRAVLPCLEALSASAGGPVEPVTALRGEVHASDR